MRGAGRFAMHYRHRFIQRNRKLWRKLRKGLCNCEGYYCGIAGGNKEEIKPYAKGQSPSGVWFISCFPLCFQIQLLDTLSPQWLRNPWSYKRLPYVTPLNRPLPLSENETVRSDLNRKRFCTLLKRFLLQTDRISPQFLLKSCFKRCSQALEKRH